MDKKVDFPIDFIISWVDQDDPVWKAKYNRYSPDSRDEHSDVRYRDYGTLLYVFRSIEKYAPWVRKVFFVTDHQVPEWLNIANEKVVLVDHTDYIESQFLPTFNSNVIELNYYKIPDLAEHFVCFNDDTLLNKTVKPTDFFAADGNPRDSLAFNAIMPFSVFDHTHVNNLSVINNQFSKKETVKKLFTKIFSVKNFEWNVFSLLLLPWPKFTRFNDPHTPMAYCKSTFEEVLTKNPQILASTCSQRFRSAEDYSIWVIRYWQMLSGNFSPRSIHFGKHYDLDTAQNFTDDLSNSKHALLNINDAFISNEADYAKKVQVVNQGLQSKFKDKSSFEV